nr:protein Rf1, mitochondrial-like [Aegilops tauschii subsp. strangulata]
MSRRLVPVGRRILEQSIKDRYYSAGIGTEDALQLFDELLPDAEPSSIRAINCLLTVIGRDCPALGVSHFNRVARANVAPNSITYTILVDCCCRAGHLDLGFAAMGHIIKMGFTGDAMITFSHLLKAICAENKTSYAMDIVLRIMPELNCTPNVFSYNILFKGLCNEKRSQEALELINIMVEDGGSCRPDVVTYSTVIDGLLKEGEVGKAYSLFCEMLRQGVSPDVVTCSSIISGMCKLHAMDKAEEVLQQMLDTRILPDAATYNSLIHGYYLLGQCEEVDRIFKEMSRNGVQPNVVTYTIQMDYLCKSGRCAEARKIFDSMISLGQKPDVYTYSILLHGYAMEKSFHDMHCLIDLMVENGIAPNHHVYNILISACAQEEMVSDVMHIFTKMRQQGLNPDAVIRSLLQKGDVPRAGTYLSKIDERSFTLEGSTATLLTALASGGEARNIRSYSLRNTTLFWNRALIETFSRDFA